MKTDNKDASSLSRAAQRMRNYRRRKRKRLRYLGVEIREREIDALISRGLLAEDKRGDNSAIVRALYSFLDATLGKVTP